MATPEHPPDENPQYAGNDPRTLRGLEAFLDQARWYADWQWRRSESFERKAGAVLAFVGIILTLQTAVVRSIITVPRTAFAWFILSFLGLSAVALVVAAMRAFAVLDARKYQGPSLRQLQEQWETYKSEGHLSDEGAVGLFSDQLLRGSGEEAPLQTMCGDADTRGERFGSALRALRYSVVLMALVLVGAALQAATEKERTDGRTGANRTAATTTIRAGATTSTVPVGGKSGGNTGRHAKRPTTTR